MLASAHALVTLNFCTRIVLAALLIMATLPIGFRNKETSKQHLGRKYHA